ncbi:hypothetical protein [Amycolatopsis sp. NPDC004378]
MDDNPAARLASVLEAARANASNDSAYPIWMRILGIEDERLLPIAIAELFAQQEQVVSAIMALPEDEDPDHLLLHMPAVSKFVMDLLAVRNVPMINYSNQVTGEMIYSLQTCARVLRRHGLRETQLEKPSLESMLDVIQNLIKEVSASNLPEQLRVLVFQRLQDVQTALTLYKIGGFPRVQESMDSLTGTTFRIHYSQPQEGSKIANMVRKLFSSFEKSAPGVKAIASSAEAVHKTIDTFLN